LKQFNKILENALVKNNLLSERALQQYQTQAELKEQSLRDYLLAEGIVTENQLLVALSQSLNLERVDLKNVNIERSLIDKIPVKFVWYYKIMPIGVQDNTLTIASAIPLNVKVQDELRVHLGFGIKVVLVSRKDLEEAFNKYYGFASETIDRIKTKETNLPLETEAIHEQWIEDIEQKSEDPTVAQLVNEIILEAYKKRATDIHIEPYRNKVRFRYRIDGVLVDANLPDDVKVFLPAILSRIKILANLSITEKRLPQDGSAVVQTKEQQLDLRVSTIPTPRGESMVLRILPTKVILFSLEKLGFNERAIEQFRHLIKKPHGIIFLTGPTGSGKTTTLYACLNEINSSEKKIITIEDPVEYEMQGITQVQVNPKVNFDFATGLRSLLRHDPDIMMVGEVRDPETAEIAIKTALTGHLVFSTLHTNDAASAVTRLIDMGIEPYLVASSVEAFIAQRLVRVICSKCKERDSSPPPAIKEEIIHSLNLTNPNDIKIYKGKGCDHCNQTGFYGRVAIFECLTLNDTIKAAILEKPRSDHIKKIAVQEGMSTLRQSGWQAVLKGITTPDEVMNVTTRDDSDDNPRRLLKADIPNRESGDFHFTRDSKQERWLEKNKYDGRLFMRSYEPVRIRYHMAPSGVGLNTDNTEIVVMSNDISAGGLSFLSKDFIPIGTTLEAHIELTGQESMVSCRVKVGRVEQRQIDNLFVISVYYLDISDDGRFLIDRFVKGKLMKKENISV